MSMDHRNLNLSCDSRGGTFQNLDFESAYCTSERPAGYPFYKGTVSKWGLE